MKRLEKNESDKEDILASEGKLQALGYVEYVKNLPSDIQELLASNPVKNFIPWRAVWKGSSISTPCRIVFDASMPTDSGFSLNDLLAKGRNNMNKLVEIFLRWRGHRIGFHTDVQKMYNSVKLQMSDWCLQRYLWQQNLEPDKPPEEKVIKTLIYGIKSSGNQAEHGLRETAHLFKDQYPEVDTIISEDVYVDDCLSGSSTINATMKLTDQVELILNRGGFTLKGITMSGKDPLPSLSSDGITVSVAGLRWHPKNDIISLDIKDLNFSKKYRGKKLNNIKGIPARLTRRHCTSKTAEIFDISGLITPITATLKLDLHNLVQRKLQWDDAIPDNLRSLWISHFEMISEIKNITYQRAVVPEDAQNLQINTLDFADASPELICVAIYLRFPLSNGRFSCQLIFARSRLVPEAMTQPRAELYAAVLNAHAGQVVKKAFYRNHARSYKFTDSQVVLHWICNESRPLKQWVRNRIIEIHRFTSTSSWQYVKSSDMIADIGTRRCVSLNEVKSDSTWINGFEWMREDDTKFPALSAKDIALNQQEIQEIKKEVPKDYEAPIPSTHLVTCRRNIPEEVGERYKFSSYLIDPNMHRFSAVVRIVAIIIKFIRNLQASVAKRSKHPVSINTSSSTPCSVLTLSDELLKEAEMYFYKKGTQEIKKFTKSSQYASISKEYNDVLFYTGRILPSDSVTIVGKATQVMKDLSTTSFCVPIPEKYSPIAYSITNDIHWYHHTAAHSGIETTWRYVLQKVYILEGRLLVKSIRSSCERCRYLMKRTIDVPMGPVSPHNLTIAPAFYATQLDLCGPFQAYSHHHKRTTIKIWLVVFCCATTTAVNIKVMEDYSTTAFLQAFTRFSCEAGYPKILLPDEGSQLLKGCQSMKFDLQDIQWKLHTDVNVDFQTCPVGGHNMHGRVERKIREIKSSMEKSTTNQRLSIMQWETFAARTANSINNLPLAVRNFKGDFEVIDLITPNRLRLGRNNDRSPVGRFNVTDDSDKIIRQNQQVHDAWFELWLTSHVPTLMLQPKWFKCDIDLKEGDVILFLKQDSVLCSTYQFGVIQSVERGRDDKIRKAMVRYRNANESIDRTTYRSVRNLVVIHRVDELNIMNELYEAGRMQSK